MLFTEVVEQFIQSLMTQERSQQTLSGYWKDLQMVNRYLESKYNCQLYLDDIQTQDLEDYLVMLKEEKGYQPASRNRHLNTIRSFYNFTTKKELLPKNPAVPLEQVKVAQKERDYVTREEMELIVKEIDHKLIQLVVQFLFYTGLRITECLNLTCDDVDFETNLIHVRNGKGNKERYVPISAKIRPLILHYYHHERPDVSTDVFFATKKTGRLSSVYVNRVLAETKTKLGWNRKMSAHLFRHGFASELIKQNVNPVKVQKLLGHADLKTTSIYVHTDRQQLVDSINKL